MAGGYTLLTREDHAPVPAKTGWRYGPGGNAAEEPMSITSTRRFQRSGRVTRMARHEGGRRRREPRGPILRAERGAHLPQIADLRAARLFRAVAEEIDDEVRRLVSGALPEKSQVDHHQYRELDDVAQRLLEVKTITREEFIFPRR